jgi:hypothetical protein
MREELGGVRRALSGATGKFNSVGSTPILRKDTPFLAKKLFLWLVVNLVFTRQLCHLMGAPRGYDLGRACPAILRDQAAYKLRSGQFPRTERITGKVIRRARPAEIVIARLRLRNA